MPVLLPQFSKSQVDKAGRMLSEHINLVRELNGQETTWAVRRVLDWRECHNYPLRNFHNSVSNAAQKADIKAVVVHRLKRFPSILGKLRRHPRMALTQMQDIGGCRAILKDVRSVRAAVRLFKGRRRVHSLREEYDYIAAPQSDGYRGIHLVYHNASRNFPQLNGLRIELQFRSQMQHIWATAVEIVDTFTQQSLKSKAGRPEWTRFFALMSAMIALKEKTAPVPDTPSDPGELAAALAVAERTCGVRALLRGIHVIEQFGALPPERAASLFLIELNVKNKTVNVRVFSQESLPDAVEAYNKAEQQDDTNAVMVNSSSIRQVRAAYPNYFGETQAFLALLAEFSPE